MLPAKNVYATFVLPAPNGCNLGCPYCVIAHRQEAVKSILAHDDYIHFLTDILINLKINRVYIQGFEPLLPETWPLTKAMLKIAGKFGCDTSFVTNGTYLAEHASEIGGFPGLVETLTVSLDSDNAARHDKLRGKTGSFVAAIEGIKAVSKTFRGDLIVNSVLFPGKHSYLVNMPELLSQLRIKEWAISPLIKVGPETKVPHGAELKASMLKLCAKAKAHGIKVFLSDELRQTAGTDLFRDFYVRSLGTDEEVFRLAPDGSCSRGAEVLGTSVSVPNWNTSESPTSFLTRIFAENDVGIKKRSHFFRAMSARKVYKPNHRKEV